MWALAVPPCSLSLLVEAPQPEADGAAGEPQPEAEDVLTVTDGEDGSETLEAGAVHEGSTQLS